jgi:hypothetical protein
MADIAPAEGVVVEIDEDGAPAPAPVAADPDVVELPENDDDLKGLPKHAIVQQDGSVRLPLNTPVTLRFRKGSTGETREERLDDLHLRRLTGADMRAISAASKDAQAAVAIARSARIAEGKFGAIYDRMDAADIGAAARVLDHFFSPGPKTGR